MHQAVLECFLFNLTLISLENRVLCYSKLNDEEFIKNEFKVNTRYFINFFFFFDCLNNFFILKFQKYFSRILNC